MMKIRKRIRIKEGKKRMGKEDNGDVSKSVIEKEGHEWTGLVRAPCRMADGWVSRPSRFIGETRKKKKLAFGSQSVAGSLGQWLARQWLARQWLAASLSLAGRRGIGELQWIITVGNRQRGQFGR